MSEQFTFFYRTAHPFSQWYACTFEIDGHRFNCAEQYMMYGKAMLFGDDEIAHKITQTADPREQKALGRQVRNFDPEVWGHEAKNVVYKANYAKFTQNDNLKKFLLKTEGTTLVEASPTDIIWGIGLPEDHPDRFNRTKWRGTNWLGEVLTQLREDLL
jgi:ribA/ribD-fused uncharacterized protein